ncbi:helix-turn-helix domain-containing protein [Fulvivirgaceae bacterium BMA12]|uniref:Helix-turn-helix domain-containing protein n=1 Tax=Agaribacillus aureus TaxID=3051825 RepID=A0ABT8LAH5_9BACT|nr:helix-turn-helix domain-containing protein [Fulvivirgaceae bacterium BMA12]
MGKNSIKTYSTETFRHKFMKPEQELDTILKSDYGKFFIVRVEEMIQLIKLPVPPTRATTHSLIYLTEGEAIMTIGSETFTMYKDECLFVPAGQIFSFSNADVNKGYLCNFHNDFFVGKFGKKDLLKDFEFLTVWGNCHVALDSRTSYYVGHLLQRILEDYAANGLKHTNIIQPYFIAALCEIARVYQPLSSNKKDQSVKIANKFKELLFSKIKTIHLVNEYASLLNITPNHLNKVVKRITGKSPAKWINEILVMEAKVLLYQTDIPIREVAAEIGIFDQSYFSRLFKKYEGVTPLQFRKMIEIS